MAQSLDDPLEKTDLAERGAASQAWRKSTRSIANGQCIEAATLADGRLAVRDSFDKAGPVATFTVRGWRTFLRGIKDGDFDAMRTD
jgi:Domain of unknown function (DUF397)